MRITIPTLVAVVFSLIPTDPTLAQERWKPVFDGRADAFYATSSDTVFVAVRDSIFRTTAGGTSWSFYKEVSIPDDSSLGSGYYVAYHVAGIGVSRESKVILSFYQYVHFYIGAGLTHTFLRHEDSAWGWTSWYSVDWQAAPPSELIFYDGDYVAAFGASDSKYWNELMPPRASFYWSSDGGCSWEDRFPASTAHVRTDVARLGSFASSSHIFLDDEKADSYVVQSTDSGRTWEELELRVGDNISAMTMLSDRTAIVATPSGIYRSDDTLRSFSEVSQLTDVTRFYCSSSDVVYAAGTLLHRSTSGGRTWEPTGALAHSNIQVLGDSTLYALERDTLFKLTSETLDVDVYSEEESRLPYPNPCYSTLFSPNEVDWYDAVGNQVSVSFQRSNLGYVYDVHLLPRGVYFLHGSNKSSKVVLH